MGMLTIRLPSAAIPDVGGLPLCCRGRSAAVLAGLCVAFVAACGAGQDSVVVGAPGAVVREGSRVIGTGRVVSVPDRPMRLCANAPTAGVGYEPGSEPAPELCEHGVDVTGVDLTVLDERREKDGAVEDAPRWSGSGRTGRSRCRSSGRRSRPRYRWARA